MKGIGERGLLGDEVPVFSKFIYSTFTIILGLVFNQDKPKLENTIYTVPQPKNVEDSFKAHPLWIAKMELQDWTSWLFSTFGE